MLLNILVFTFNFAQYLIIFFCLIQSRKFAIVIKFFKDSNNRKIVFALEIKFVSNNLFLLNISLQTRQDID